MKPFSSSLNEYINWAGLPPRFRSTLVENRLFLGHVATLVCAASMIWGDCQVAHSQVMKGSNTQWLRGRQLTKNQAMPVSVTWIQSPIRDQFLQFSSQQKRAIFLDRRVDPTSQLTFQFINQTTEQIVWATAETQGLGVSRVGDVLYVGPKESAARLPWLIKRIKKSLSSKDRKFWNSQSEIRWNDVTTTAEIAGWLESKGVKFADPIPPDVWPSADWPRMTLLEQVSLFLIGFDSDFEIAADGRSVKLIESQPIKDQTIKVRIPADGTDPFQIAKTILALKVRRSGKTVAITGDIVSLLDFEASMVGAQKADIANGDGRSFTMDTESASRRDIFTEIARQTERELIVDDSAARSLEDRIALKIAGASLKELLNACIEGTGLAYQIEEKSLRIYRKQ